MAKEDKAKIKMTVIHFETESDNSTLQENICAITQTLTRALASQPRVVYTPAHLPPPSGTGTALETEIDDNSDILDGEVTPSSSTSPSSKEKSRRHQSRTPQPIELDLASGSMLLKAFLEQKNPDGDTKRYLAIRMKSLWTTPTLAIATWAGKCLQMQPSRFAP